MAVALNVSTCSDEYAEVIIETTNKRGLPVTENLATDLHSETIIHAYDARGHESRKKGSEEITVKNGARGNYRLNP